MSSSEEEIKKKRDPDLGEVIFDKDNYPICSEHGYSLWISEKSIMENTALCLFSDEIISAAKNVNLTKEHLSTNNIPEELDYLSGLFHSGDKVFGR